MAAPKSHQGLALPGKLTGLLQKGSPVIWYRRSGEERRGVFLRWTHDAVPYALVAVVDDGSVVVRRRESLSLDLTDATGRYHAAKALAGYPALWSVDARRLHCWKVIAQDAPDRLRNRYWLHPVGDDVADVRRWPDTWVVVQGLAGLNSDDPLLLPDGSRWVDAEALRLVCLHVLGVR